MVTEPKAKTLRHLITRFFDAKRHLAPGTLEFYGTMLGNFEWYKKASPSTVHHYGLVIKTLFNWAEDEGYLDDNPSRRLKIGGPRYKDVHPYTDEEVRALPGENSPCKGQQTAALLLGRALLDTSLVVLYQRW